MGRRSPVACSSTSSAASSKIDHFEQWLIDTKRDLHAGRLDEELVYRKRLRRDVDVHAKGGAPAHVPAARRLGESESEASEIEYVVTMRGPERVGKLIAPIDHGYYFDKQLAPVWDVILPFVGTSFQRIAGAQTSLF